MRNRIRIFLVCFFLIGGTAIFAYQFLNQLNIALNDLSASSFAIANIPPSPFSNKTKKEQTPISTTETISTSIAAADLKLSFIFPKKNNEVYIGCTYQLSFQSPTIIHSLETTLIDAGSRKAIEPAASGLARENKIKTTSQSFDWKVRFVWPGEYYIKVSNFNGIDLKSKIFTIKKMPKDINDNKKEKNCKESDGRW